MSVAGNRKGLKGEESGLFHEQIRLIKEMREHDKANRGADVDIRHIKPRYLVWENVCGAFSSGTPKGEDFRIVLEEACKVADSNAYVPRPKDGKWAYSGCIMGDGWSVAWRVHDAQFWGVPQRRKRIALVADFGGPTAPEILFERKSVSGDIAESREQRERVATDIEGCPDTAISFQERAGCSGGGKGILIQNDRTGALQTSNNQSVLDIRGGQPTVASKASFFCKARSDGKADTLVASDYKDPQLVCYGLDRASFNQGKNAKYGFAVEEELSPTLVAKGPGGWQQTVGSLCARDYKGVGTQYVSEGKVIVDLRKSSE